MTATSFECGHAVFWDKKSQKWRYLDNGEIANDKRICIRCGELPTSEGYDACLGHIPGIKSACCGHGIEAPYEVKE